MKKYLVIILILFGVLLLPKNVMAQNYGIRELIPVGVKNTLVSHNFSYKNFYYNKDSKTGIDRHTIYFKGIKNLSDEEKPISISIGLFGKNRRNIGTINYCGREDRKVLKSKEEKEFSIRVDNRYIREENVLDDIYYIAILGDNVSCNVEGSLNYIGQTVEEIGYKKNTTLDVETERLLKVLTVVGAVIVAIFLYKFLFTNSYQNFDGDDTRREFKNINKRLKEEREFEERVHPKPKPVKKKTKTDEVIAQEEQAKNQDKDSTELHNFYK